MTNDKEVKKYTLFYERYNIFARGYVRYVETVVTDDIYHEIGWLICNSIESVQNVRYALNTRTDKEDNEVFSELGFVKIDDGLWRQEEVEE